MSDIPFLILIFVSAVNLALPLIMYTFRTSFPISFILWLGGIIWLMLFITSDNIDLGQQIVGQHYDSSSQTIVNDYDCNCYAIRDSITFEPSFMGMMLIVMSLGYIMAGVLTERVL